MKKITFSLFVILTLLQSCNVGADTDDPQEEADPISESEESTATKEPNNAIARLVSVKIGHDDLRIAAVQDNSSSAGYAVEITHGLSEKLAQRYYYITAYARVREQPHFRKYIVGTSLCSLLTNVASMNRYQFTLPAQITRMIFAGFNNTCEAQDGTTPMLSTAYVHADPEEVLLPFKRDFNLSVNVVSSNDFPKEDTKYIFQVNFTVELLDSSGRSSEEDEKSGHYCFHMQWNYWILWQICKAFEFIEPIFGMA